MKPESRKQPDARPEQGPQRQGLLFQRSETHSLEIRNLPDPEELARYGQIVPGMPEALLDAFLTQGQHRRKLESRVITNQIVQSYVGQGLGAAIALLTIWRSTEALLAGHPIAGLAGLIGALGAVVSVFVIGRRNQGNELAEKRETRR